MIARFFVGLGIVLVILGTLMNAVNAEEYSKTEILTIESVEKIIEEIPRAKIVTIDKEKQTFTFTENGTVYRGVISPLGIWYIENVTVSISKPQIRSITPTSTPTPTPT
ncbi:MAG: hypothetical protein QME61_02790, partial [Patescibacteria group bacterium]|nr:hypothetical protein [Patescibacteria group bacterium]